MVQQTKTAKEKPAIVLEMQIEVDRGQLFQWIQLMGYLQVNQGKCANRRENIIYYCGFDQDQYRFWNRGFIEVFPENDRKPIGDQHDQGGECNREKGITRNGK